MDSLFLLQFACFIFMLINAFIVAVSHLHVRWENKRYERSRLLIVVAMIGLAIQYVIQMQGRRIKLRCSPKVLTDTLHPSLPSIFSG